MRHFISVTVASLINLLNTMITLLHQCYMMSSDGLVFSFGLMFLFFVLFFFLILEENGGNLNTQKTDDHATEETKMTNDP